MKGIYFWKGQILSYNSPIYLIWIDDNEKSIIKSGLHSDT